jgi:asparagine N-glycosylation enzyme membrane subunit Stt3
MRKAVSRNLYLLALVLIVGAAVLAALGMQGMTLSTLQNAPSTLSTLSSMNNPGLVLAGLAAVIVAGLLVLISWIGALVRTAQLGRWGWFVCLIVLSGITLLIYVFAGPTTPANQPAYTGQYPPQYPRQ